MSKDRYLISCPICGAVNEADKEDKVYCRRCGSKIYNKKSRSFQISLAFLITAMIFYIPANVYPILKTFSFTQEQDSTIIGGVITLWHHGSYPIAVIVFLASIVVPIVKFCMMLFLLFWKKLGFKHPLAIKSKLYYIAEFIGPWSMIDIFVVGILSALIHFNIASIKPGIAATSFALSVVFTMLSALNYDKRLLED